MSYFVYENWRAESKPRATVHFANCSFCNNGKGIHAEADTRNGKWHGPFVTAEAARTPMVGRVVAVRSCGHCRPY